MEVEYYLKVAFKLPIFACFFFSVPSPSSLFSRSLVHSTDVNVDRVEINDLPGAESNTQLQISKCIRT